jgi:hypothetical protein
MTTATEFCVLLAEERWATTAMADDGVNDATEAGLLATSYATA